MHHSAGSSEVLDPSISVAKVKFTFGSRWHPKIWSVTLLLFGLLFKTLAACVREQFFVYSVSK